ncbi:hypothetical protein COV04_04615 [Candidatus Uhrbacteria bacterium CG10_big_fil_rev_8_21_14_0_10_48_11]|uniref:Glycoside hydrolase family 5 domain-containing protein n=1 Tax=Candidatus Uhrbacteria bacterium CG10_big_fil_rev_8_21_14_0_10_48_11 TaxID=1975037 RepID=A0A2M8LDH8_9BACT|nr:MAG: hypothetical protein COV04_04615 [Candidatus Uhrbacteria bacterium CG10_big_fil_rev_8_21_14_0_10_48_11]
MDPHRLPRWFRRTIFVFLGLLIVLTPPALYIGRAGEPVKQLYGVTFSDKQARALGLEARETYLAILNDLKVKHLRLIAYWDELEPTPNTDNFSELDWELQEAANHNATVTLAIGRKLPRWPECFYPDWMKGKPLAEENQQLLTFLRKIITRYRDQNIIVRWQIENEPFVWWFGDCAKPDEQFLQTELDLLKSLSDKPVLITDSGELSTWRKAARFADLFGTTLYRATWNPYLHYGVYPLPPLSYRLKARLWWVEPKDAIIAELQAEPWPPGTPLIDTPVPEQFKSMSLSRFNEQVTFAKATNFGEAYFWGVEWWYWLKMKQNHPEFWQTAKALFAKSSD